MKSKTCVSDRSKYRVFEISFIMLLSILVGCEEQNGVPPPGTPLVFADIETTAVQARTADDAADDPAIWVNPIDSSKSLIIGTVKGYGLEVYNLNGEVLHSYKIGNPNNVDVRYGFPLANGEKIDLVASSDRSTNEILIFRINPADLSLSLISGGRLKSSIRREEVYGICLYKSPKTGDYYVFLNGKGGSVEQFLLKPFGENEVTGELVRTLKLSTQPEGLVADDQTAFVYMGEEDRGIWKVAAEPDQPTTPVLLAESDESNPRIAYDIEGLTIFYTGDSTGYLIASSQGNNTYAVFERQGSNKYLGSFGIGDSGLIDGTYDTDGIDVSGANLGGPFSSGLFVAQDGANTDQAGKMIPQNFKLVGWGKVKELYWRD